jgi:hypothetical protein
MDQNRMKALAEMLLTAEQSQKPIPPLTESDPGISVDEAYRIQLLVMETKKAHGQKGEEAISVILPLSMGKRLLAGRITNRNLSFIELVHPSSEGFGWKEP